MLTRSEAHTMYKYGWACTVLSEPPVNEWARWGNLHPPRLSYDILHSYNV